MGTIFSSNKKFSVQFRRGDAKELPSFLGYLKTRLCQEAAVYYNHEQNCHVFNV